MAAGAKKGWGQDLDCGRPFASAHLGDCCLPSKASQAEMLTEAQVNLHSHFFRINIDAKHASSYLSDSTFATQWARVHVPRADASKPSANFLST